MNLYRLYKSESSIPGTSVVVMALLSGVANAGLLAIINIAIRTTGATELSYRYFLLFFIALGIFIAGKKYSLEKCAVISENIIRGIRVRLADKIRKSDLADLERIGRADIYNRIAQDTETISQASMIIVNALQASTMLLFCVLYLATLSKLAFFLTVASVVVGTVFILRLEARIIAELRETAKKENVFLGHLQQVIHGFKELKLARKKSADHFQRLATTALETEALKIQTRKKFVVVFLFSQTFFYLLLAAIIFLMPQLDQIGPQLVVQITATILFIVGPIEILVNAIPFYQRANVAVENLYTLEEKLDQTRQRQPAGEPASSANGLASFEEIVFDQVSFHYRDTETAAGFKIGPIDLTIRKGELLFLIGGNGSGKSTLLKLLTGLYYPAGGEIRVDGKPLTAAATADFREMFSAIFGDFHLFDRVYGIDAVDTAKVEKLLRLMRLEDKVRFQDGAFSDINLSTGQKKRLAMIVSILDDRPICVFDEWAADQDPEFRQYFYETLLRDFQAQGKTIIAVSHDDRYFAFADRVLKMDYGRMVPFNDGQVPQCAS
ncbi:MAG: cyclic peptide export ABC transporter [Desulfuromonadales bacterium]